jgi:hypothetical protein
MSQPPTESLVGIAINPGFHETMTPTVDELRALAPHWLRYLPSKQFQNFATGQNAALDWVLNHIHDLGIQLLVLINPETVNALPPSHPESTFQWGDATSGYIGFVADFAQRFATVYRDRIAAIEIFNEPEVQQIPAAEYGRLLAACYQRIKNVSNLPVISAGIAFDDSFDYLRGFTQMANGAYDGIGWHPYAMRLDGFPSVDWGRGEMRDSINTARRIGGKPIWLTEIGANLNYLWPQNAPSEPNIAEYLTRMFQMVRGMGSEVVARAFWFTWKFPANPQEPNADWGLVDVNGNRRLAWSAFQQQTHNISTAPPQIVSAQFTPTTLEAGQELNVAITIRNHSSATYPTQVPRSGTLYEEADTFASRGFTTVNRNAVRVGVDYEGRTGIDRPYRWGLAAPLRPGQTATINGRMRLQTPRTTNYWTGIVLEQVAWVQDRVGVQAITVKAAPQPPMITHVTFSPTTLEAGEILTVSITVRNDSAETLPTQDPAPDFLYEEGDTYESRGFAEVTGAVRVGVEFEGRPGTLEYPYRWGLGAPLAPGQTATITGRIRLQNAQTKRYWAGFVREQIEWLQRDQNPTTLTVRVVGDCAELQEQVARLQTQIAQLQQQLAQATATNDQLRAALAQIRQIAQNTGA